MPKKHKLASQTFSLPAQITNWDMCVLCQETGGTLINPSATGYETLATNLSSLQELNKLPLNINVSRLNDGNGIQKTLVAHSARWHKTCYVLCNATKVQRARVQLDKASEHLSQSPHKHHIRGRRTDADSCTSATEGAYQQACFFCDTSSGEFHKAETLEFDTRVRHIATELRDTKLLAKLSAGDMVAIDAVYHLKCLTAFYNRHRSQQRSSSQSCGQISLQSLALAEVVSYIEEYRQVDGDLHHVFKLTDLKKLYSECLQKLGGDINANIHSTRFTQKLLQHIPTLEAHNSKSGTVLSFKEQVGDALLDACEFDSDDEAVMLMRVARLIRKDVFENKYSFCGSLCDEQYDNLPTSLSALVRMILVGLNAGQHIGDYNSCNAISSITQLLVYNAVKRSRRDSGGVRHNLDRETVLPLYLGLLIHNRTRKRDLIDNLFDKGLCVSYDRVLQFSTDEANSVIDKYGDTVCPSSLKEQLFTTGNLDNIDHNPSSTSSRDSFHGTAISVTQHITNDSQGVVRVPREIPENSLQAKSKLIKSLPKSYTDVPPVFMPDNVTPTVADENMEIDHDESFEMDQTGDKMQKVWFEKVCTALKDENQDDSVFTNISWSAHFADLQKSVPKPPAIISLLPLFRDAAHSPAMVKHGMNIIQQITTCVNPGQIPVLTVDQPLYAIAKRIQWKWPDEYGERQYVVLMGGLHIEMAMLNLIGDWLDGSGWTYVMTSANVTTEGRAAGLQKGSHVARGQWAHQVTAAALFVLLRRSYVEYQSSIPDDEQLPYDDWCLQIASKYPQFDYWYTVWQLELLFLQFLRSQREQRYAAYVDSLGKIVPWMFALDHYHYARWMTVHLRDLLALETKCPSIQAQFFQGNFVTQKTSHKFSALAHDQVHEQLNAMVKGDGGIIGITENEAALTRWMVAGPETARLLMEYDKKQSMKTKDIDRHHEQIPSVQMTFLSQVRCVVDMIEDIGNPFSDTSTDLYTLDTKQIMSSNVVQTVRSAENVGKTQYHEFVAERFNDKTTAFNDTIHKNNLALFSSRSEKVIAKSTSKISNLRDDVHLFSRMYITCQVRESNMDDFFGYENHAWPPSLASNGIIHQTNKSDLMECLESLVPITESVPNVDVKIIDGAALVNMLDPKKAQARVKTFQDYSRIVFMPYIERMLQVAVRVDVAWDVYREDSLKAQTRQNRGSGYHLKVENSTNVPSNWKNFLRCDANKQSLFKLLAIAVQEFQPPQHKQVISTLGQDAVSSPIIDLSELSCSHEEADTRLFFHSSHAFHHGFTKQMIHATDTDVIVLAIAVSTVLHGCEIWVAFGHGSKLRYIPCHLIAAELGEDASHGLLFMHAISGCDTVSAFRGIGKKTAWTVWRSMLQLVPIVSTLSRAPRQITADDMDQIERYVVVLYQRTSALSHVNEARKELFSRNRTLENIPPTYNALVQHVQRAAYQAGHILGQSLIGHPEIPSPALWGWEKKRDDSNWTPLWTTLPEASKSCQELLKCGCKKSCTKRCKCVKANLQCTQLCACLGQCNQD